jgi:hypothetical protein
MHTYETQTVHYLHSGKEKKRKRKIEFHNVNKKNIKLIPSEIIQRQQIKQSRQIELEIQTHTHCRKTSV